MNKQQINRIIVSVSLLLLLIVSSFIFGPNVLLIGTIAILTSFVIEFLNSVIRKEKFDPTTFVISPLIITLLTTPTIINQVWIVAVATAFGVFFAKIVFGGQSKNIFNPAMVGLIFISISFPVFVNAFGFTDSTGTLLTQTPAELFKTSPLLVMENYSILDLLLGSYPGGLGTTFKLGILILGILLMLLKITNWRIPLVFLGTYFVLSVINFLLKGFGLDSIALGGYALLMGNLLFASMFVAVDPATTPIYTKGTYIYAALLGLVTWMIQAIWIFNTKAANTEGIIYSITFMNAVVGLIDVWTVPKIKNVPEMIEE